MNLIGYKLPVKDDNMAIVGYRTITEQYDLENVAAFSIKVSNELYSLDGKVVNIFQGNLPNRLISYNEALELVKANI